MSVNKSIFLGILGLIMHLFGLILVSTTTFCILNYNQIYLHIVFLISNCLILISLYSLLKYTDKSRLGTNLNLLGFYSYIPFIVFDLLKIFSSLFPIVSTLFTGTTLYLISNTLSDILFLLCVFGVVYYRTPKLWLRPIYILTLICIFVTYSISIINCLSTIFKISYNFHFNINATCLMINIFISIALIFFYRKFIYELINIADKNETIFPEEYF